MLIRKSFVIQVICFESRFTTRMSNFVRARFWKTIFFPSGDQAGAMWLISSLVSVVICCGYDLRGQAAKCAEDRPMMHLLRFFDHQGNTPDRRHSLQFCFLFLMQDRASK